MPRPSSSPSTPSTRAPSQETEALEQQLVELREALAARDEFISIAAHELRNSLSPVYLQVQVMLDSVRKHPDRVDAAWLTPRLEGFAFRLERFVASLNRILDVSRISTGRLHLDLEDVDISELVTDLVESLRREAAAAGSEIVVAIERGVVGRWDRMRLEQICGNLISNAIRYGAGRPIGVELRATDEVAELVVRDRGIGIAEHDLPRIFARFERATARHRGGFGVGLWLVSKLCTAMGGSVRVDSRVGEGSTFTVRLPRHSS